MLVTIRLPTQYVERSSHGCYSDIDHGVAGGGAHDPERVYGDGISRSCWVITAIGVVHDAYQIKSYAAQMASARSGSCASNR